MNPKDLFQVALKVIGVLSLGRGLYDCVYVTAFSLGSGDFSVTAKFPGFDLLLGIIYSVLGFYLLRGGSMIVNFAYPSSKSEEDIDESTTSADD